MFLGRPVRGCSHSRVELGKSEICVIGIEKSTQTYVTRLFAYSSQYFRPRRKCRQQQVWGEKKQSSWDKLFQVISVEKRIKCLSKFFCIFYHSIFVKQNIYISNERSTSTFSIISQLFYSSTPITKSNLLQL